MENPFAIIEKRLSNIESLLLDLKHENIEKISFLKAKEDSSRKGLLTKKEAAKLLACSTSTIDNFARAGKLNRFYLGKTVRFKEEELLALAEPNS